MFRKILLFNDGYYFRLVKILPAEKADKYSDHLQTLGNDTVLEIYHNHLAGVYLFDSLNRYEGVTEK